VEDNSSQFHHFIMQLEVSI